MEEVYYCPLCCCNLSGCLRMFFSLYIIVSKKGRDIKIFCFVFKCFFVLILQTSPNAPCMEYLPTFTPNMAQLCR